MTVETVTELDAGPAVAASGMAVSAHRLVHIYRVEGNDVVALSNVDLDIAAGQTVALLGPSGSGKSTFVTLLAGLQRPSAGRLQAGGYDLLTITTAERDRLRALDVGVVLQGALRNLLPYATARQNVAFAQRSALKHGKSLPSPVEILDLLGIADLADRPLAGLTPGRAQMTAVAVGMAAMPGLLLADEPTSQLDHEHRDEVLSAMLDINDRLGTTVLIVTHDPDVAARMSRRITIRDGRVGSEGRQHDTEDLAVVSRDGALQLPPEILATVPPGSLLRVRQLENGDIVLSSNDDSIEGWVQP